MGMTESFVVELIYMILDFLKLVVDIFTYAEAWSTFIVVFIIYTIYRFILSPFLGHLSLGSDSVIEDPEVITGLEKRGRR